MAERLGSIPEPPKEVIFRIKRYDPETGRSWWQEYRVQTYRGMTVLDALIWIKERLDPTLSMRYSCRQGVCGSCGMLINGTPRLACQTQVGAIATNEKPVVTVEPLPNFPVVRDLVTDFTRFFEKHRAIMPYIIRRNPREVDEAKYEFLMSPEEHMEIYQYSLCIMCGLCYAACPVAASDPEYLGPQALTQAYRFIVDVRDEGAEKRIAVVDTEHGCHRCHFAASCSAVCPKDVDPAAAIQRLRRIVFLDKLGLWRKRKTSKVAGPLEKPLRQVKAEYPKHNLLEGVDPEQQAREPVNIDLHEEWLRE
ncbi:succinate dehydrogenase/fumarate reductase iron-sulfur subunit [Hyperthermus butylicus]|uniref:succinate dehydrogenase n=1 Tax=Hyperthermus butylicus (strain DSM 5456 / JCM 9403 / PLM1-5) TaxID=415426 RepID=A2BJ68_HYPBU|nr:succinate dehydrogenase/fumarate reductase iron-sulfur subunit [Hyperthermus butylicus]ABM80029.1 Succinate dehydrogenase/fumarate reductase iron-sulfur protein [Hyperthermus butylicus DSM 5456]